MIYCLVSSLIVYKRPRYSSIYTKQLRELVVVIYQFDATVMTATKLSRSLSSSSNVTTPLLKKDDYTITIVPSNSSSEANEIGDNPFLDPKVEEYYREVYQTSNYECYPAFDPQFEWTKEEEQNVVRKLNYRVALAACLLFVGLQIDRGNLQQAISDNMLNDLALTTNEYNLGNTLFYSCFLLAEVPSQLISKSLGPDIFIPIQMCAWSVVAISQAALSGKVSFYLTRALIGMLDGGFIADLVLWLSYFFTSKELPIRLSWFWTTLAVVQIGSSLLACGILKMRGLAGLEGWRWLFLIEGTITFFIGLSAFYLMVPSAVETRNWMHPKGWFSDREEKIVVNRILRDDPTKGSMNNRQALGIKELGASLMDYNLWPIFAIGLIAYIGKSTMGTYFTLMNKELGFSTFETNLLAIPPSILHISFLLGITWLSERANERSFVSLVAPLYAVPLIAIIRWWHGSGKQVWATWMLSTLFLGQPYIHAICVAWVSRNSNSVGSRSICSALYNMFVQMGAIIALNIYREDDFPLYKKGNTILFLIELLLIPLLLFTKCFYIWKNNQKGKLWNKMTEEEREYYRKHSTDRGNERLDFVFEH